jgi:hypothetical protein
MPTEENIAKAAEAACRRIKDAQSTGRPSNAANWILAEGLSKIFRQSGHSIARRRAPLRMVGEKVVYTELGLFHDFVTLVVPPLQDFLREHGLPPVTIDSVVRMAIEETR